ncbi:MAG TPA: NACHT domain-containing protein, partial [Candidatus Sericytochromatia bacterium]
MEWTEFLAEIADAHCLSPEQTEAFLIRLQEGNRGDSEAKLASKLNISAYAFKKRMSAVYEQFAQSCPELAASENRGKLKKLRAYLRTKYSERSHKPLTHPDVSNVGTIQPIQEDINWHEVCGKVLAQQRSKQNFRRSITGRHLGHEAKNVYVKLGLVKPKEQPRRGDEFQPSADRGMLQYQLTEKEIEQEYQYDEFLEQVIEGKEKNLTIVGEPGAGKSTWLEQIALYVDNSNTGFPICISLASLGGKTLEEYLFQIWLKNALLISQCDVGITSAQKKLEELFQSGKVWLLLDGVDEMRADESPLQAIATQLEGWGDLARVVLTCRSNVWEANPNALLNFETYRTLHFDDEQVGDFIQQWFTQEGKPKLGEELETKLDDTRNDRIRDLIKNPLRLAMLCGIWYFHQGDLPNTKATLYQQYIEYFYRWKQHPQLTDDLD